MIAWQHPPESVWNYTPRQIAAWLEVGHARHRAEAGERLMIAAMGAQGKNETITKQLREWED